MKKNIEIEKAKKEILDIYGNEYCVFNIENNTLFRPVSKDFVMTKNIIVAVSFDDHIDAYDYSCVIEEWASNNDIRVRLQVVTLREANKIINDN